MGEIGKLDLKKIGVRDYGCGIPVFLSRMVPDQKYKMDRIPLYKLDKNNRPIRTIFFLEGTLTCKGPGKFYFELRPKFGKDFPSNADIKVYGSEISPVRLIRNGVPVQVAGLPFEAPPEIDKVTFLVTTDGSNDAPKVLFAILRNIPPESSNDDNPTIPTGLPVPQD